MLKYSADQAEKPYGGETMRLLDELRILGANVDEGLNRFMGNAALYERMLAKLPDMMSKIAINDGFEAEDVNDLIEKTHSIKGVTGNLSLTPLYEAYTKIVDLLRMGNVEEANRIYLEVLPVQEEILARIRNCQ